MSTFFASAFPVSGSWIRVQGLELWEFEVQGLGVSGLGLLWGLGFRALGFRV